MAESPPLTIPIHPVAHRVANGHRKPHVGPHIAAYRQAHAETVGHESDRWWAKAARETLHWDRPFHTVRAGGFETGDIVWFPEVCPIMPTLKIFELIYDS